MDENEMTPEETPTPVEETPVEVAPVQEPPAWEFPTFSTPVETPVQDDPGVYDALKAEAASDATKAIGGLLQNQSALRNTLTQQGASQDTIALAEATLLSMDPRVMVQPGAAQIAASLAIGSMTMQNKSWKAPQAPAQPPPANGVGRENPSQTPPEVEKEQEAFNKAFAKMGITADMMEVPD